MIAKEARIQVDRFYSKEDLDEFTEVFFIFFPYFFEGARCGLKELFLFSSRSSFLAGCLAHIDSPPLFGFVPSGLREYEQSLTPIFEPIMGTLANYRRPQ